MLPNRALLFCLLMTVSYFVEGAERPPLTLQSALDRAIHDNPNLAGIEARSKAMEAIPSQVGSLPDPVISLNALNIPVDSFDFDQENMSQLQGGFSQAIPFPGKLALREEAASYAAGAAAQNVIEARWRLVRDVKKGWWRLYFLEQALEVVSINRGLLHQFVAIAQTKYSVGEGLQQDVLLAQLELSKLLDGEMRQQGDRNKVEAQLNSLLGEAADREIRVHKKVDEQLPEIVGEQRLFQWAGKRRALLASHRQSVNEARSRRELAKKELYPDFKVGAFYSYRDETSLGQERADFFSLKLSMTVPIFAATKQHKAIDQRNKELMQQQFSLQDEWNRVRAEISTGYSNYEQFKRQAELYKGGIIPQARQTVASMLAGYQVNKVDFLNLVRSQITLYNYETQYWKAFTQAHQALAELTAVVGKEDIYE